MIYDVALLVICAGFWYTGYLLWQMKEESQTLSAVAVLLGFFSFLAFWSVLDWFFLALGLFCLFTLIMLS